jgi:hypothetical protein
MPFDVNGQILTNYQIKNYNETRIVRSGIILYLDANVASSYPGSGTTWYDISGNSNDFTFASYNGGSNPVYTSSSNRNYFQFTGINAPAASYQGGGYMTRGASINMSYSTTSVWFNNNTSSPKVMILGGTGYESAMYQGVEIYLNGLAIGYMSTRITAGGNTAYNDLHSTYSYNTWYQLTQTYDGTTQSLYINGVLYTSAAKSGTQTTPNKHYMVGAHHVASGAPGEFNNGAIGQYLIYNRALTAAEVLQNFNATRKPYGI